MAKGALHRPRPLHPSTLALVLAMRGCDGESRRDWADPGLLPHNDSWLHRPVAQSLSWHLTAPGGFLIPRICLITF